MGTLLFNTLHSNRAARNSPFGATLAQHGQKWPQNKVPRFSTVFQQGPGQPDHAVADFQKKVGISPRWTIRQGEKPHFFPGFGERVVWVPGIFTGSCFLEGGSPITPCSRWRGNPGRGLKLKRPKIGYLPLPPADGAKRFNFDRRKNNRFTKK